MIQRQATNGRPLAAYLQYWFVRICRLSTIEHIREHALATSKSTSKSVIIEIRLSEVQKQLIERAASYCNSTVSEFVVFHAEAAGRKVIAEYESVYLDQAQSRMLVDALLSPKKPSKKLKLAMKEYQKRVESR